MKKILITTALLAGFTACVMAQGTVNFVNLSSANGVAAKIYGPEVGNNTLSLVGNTTAGLPAGGTQVYTGALLTGGGYMAQLFAANGTVADTSGMQGATPISTFRTGSGAGYFVLATATLAGVPLDAAHATFSVRVWDNSSGQYPTWDAANLAWRAGTIAAGESPLLGIDKVGGTLNTPPYLAGLQSFNIYFIPEPTVMALAGLGAAALLIFRRRN